MRILALTFAALAGLFLSGCNSTDISSPAYRAMMEPVNACGTGGTSEYSYCRHNGRIR